MPVKLQTWGFTACLLVSLAAAVLSWRRSQGRPLYERLTSAFLFPMAVSIAGIFLLKIQGSLFSDHNWERLQNAFALAHGFPLYHGPNDGPALITIYGPVSVFAYLPAALGKTPTSAMLIAETALICWFFIPALWLHTGKRKDDPVGQGFSAFKFFLFFLFCYFPMISRPLRDAAFNIHVDGPTMGLMMLACAFLYFRTEKNRMVFFALSAVSAVLSVWSKQVAVPLLPALALYLWAADGRRAALTYCAYLLVSGLVISGIFLVLFNPERLLFNILSIPGSHDLRKGGLPGLIESTFALLGEGAVTAVFAAAAAVYFAVTSRPTGLKDWLRNWRGSMFLIAALLLIPTSILGNAKVGGSTNTLCYTCAFLLLAGTFGFRHAFKSPVTRYALLVLGFVFLCIEIPWVYSRIVRFSKQTNYAETAYAYIKKHPGEAWFPRLNMLHIMAENKIYHSSASLRDRDWADMSISQEHFSRHLPEKMRFFAFQEKTSNDKPVLDPYLPKFTYDTTEPELPGFLVYKSENDRPS